MDIEAFAAERSERLRVADEVIEPSVRHALRNFVNGEADWQDSLVNRVVQVWYENFQAEAPGASRRAAEARFRSNVHDALDKTTDFGEVGQAQVDRITRWLSTYAVNAGTVQGAAAAGRRFKRWVTMRDDAVRDIHRPLDGQRVPLGGTFDVAGTKLAYPGEPKGPPEVWINCRCVAQPGVREGEAMSGQSFSVGPEDDDVDNPDVIVGEKVLVAAAIQTDIPPDAVVDDEPEDDEELITEIPVHGVLAPEGKPTGDGREFALGALSTRDMPLPLRYEIIGTHGGTTSDVVTVGRIDEAWRDDATAMWRYRGAIVLSKPYANEVIDGLIDGTVRSLSIDGDDAEIDVSSFEDDRAIEEQFANPPKTVFSKMRISGATIVPIGAFTEAYTALGHAFEDELTDADRAALLACGCMDTPVVDLSLDEVSNWLAAAQSEDGNFRDYDADDRKRMAENGQALPDGSFPIADVEDLRNAIQAIGRASDPAAAKAHIRKRAAALGESDLVPEDWSGDVEAFAPGTKDGPGWITHPVATSRIRRYWVKGEGAAKIRWGVPGDFNRCRLQLAKYVQNPDWLAGLCANMHYEALGIWPATHGKESHAIIPAEGQRVAPAVMLASASRLEYPAEFFTRPDMEVPAALVIKDDHVYGYLAEWTQCHIGIDGVCTAASPSLDNYAWFKHGVVDTTAGRQSVGSLTYGTGHASPRMRAAAATAHYDKPSAVRAHVNIGEDEFGIWFSGVLAPWVTDEDVADLLAIGAFSGDWRDVRGDDTLELIGATCVNTPGLPVPVRIGYEAGRQVSLIASAGYMGRVAEPETTTFTLKMDPETVAGIARTAVAEYRHQEKVAAQVAPARASIRNRRLSAARERIGRA